MASLAYVGGTETYTENETRNVEVSLESTDDILTPDRQDELWDCKYYHENDSTGYNDYMNFNNSSLLGMSYKGRYFSSDRIGTVITTKITFLKAISNIKISRISWQNDVEYYKNDTTLETDIIKLNNTEIYSITATKEQYGNDYITIANDITIGNVSVGDVLSFETKKEGTLDSTSDYKDLTGGLNFYFSSDPITITETVPVQKTRGINKPVSSIYAGVTATVPVYTETTTTEDVALSTNTFTDFFSADNTGTTGTNAKGIKWTDNSEGGLKLTFGNYSIDSSTSMTTFTAQKDLTNVVISGLYYTETRYDKITLTVAGTTVLNAVSGTSSTLTQRWAGSLSKGQTIILKFVKDSSSSVSNEKLTYFTLSCDPYQKTTVDKVQTGTETKLVDKKIVKGYVGGPDGKARLFFGGSKFSYTGEYTTSDVTVDGVACTLYTLTGSGTLKIGVNNAQYWMCGGGAGGAAGKIGAAPSTSPGTDNVGGGNGGGGGFTSSGTLSTGSYAVLIGAGGTMDTGGSETSIGAYSAGGGGANGNGGSGGGACGYAGFIDNSQKHINGTAGTGDGLSKYPFGIESLNAHCAGGGGGCIWYYFKRGSSILYNLRYTGGAGGSNGASGGKEKADVVGGGSGGTYGGGAGANYSVLNGMATGGDASFYGSGGGGGGSYYYDKGTANIDVSNGGNGYQGIAYVLVPA